MPYETEEERRRRLLQGPRPTPQPRADEPITLPYGSPPLTGTRAYPFPDLPATPTPPLTTPVPPLAMPRGLEPRATPTPMNDYRGNPIQDTGDFRRDQYIRQGATPDEAGKLKVPRSWKATAKNIALSFLQGAAANPNNPLWGGVGGAATGGALTAINPLAGKEYLFAQTQQPAIEAQMAKERAKEQAEREARKAGLEEQKDLAEIDLKGAQARKFLTPPPVKARAPQLRLGRNRETGRIEYYAADDPEQAAAFEPYRFPGAEEMPYTPSSLGVLDRRSGQITTPTAQKPEKPPASALKAAEGLAQQKSNVSALWKKAQEQPQGTPERATAERMAQSALDTYNNNVTQFGELYGEFFETGPGASGWSYVKRRSQPKAQPQASTPKAQPTAQRKAVVGQDFVNHVAGTLQISPAEARRRIEADGYTIK